MKRYLFTSLHRQRLKTSQKENVPSAQKHTQRIADVSISAKEKKASKYKNSDTRKKKFKSFSILAVIKEFLILALLQETKLMLNSNKNARLIIIMIGRDR